MTDAPRAVVREVDGKLVLDDPDARAMMRVVEKFNCKAIAASDEHWSRIFHFAKRVEEKSLKPNDVMLTVINVDSLWGKEFAEVFMPGQDWQAYRDKGMTPYARGIVMRSGLPKLLSEVEPEAAKELEEVPSGSLPILIVDRGIVTVVTLGELVQTRLDITK